MKIYIIGLIVTMAVVIFCIAPSVSSGLTDDEPFLAAVVQSYRGDVKVKKQSGDWERVRSGMILGMKQSIKTGLNSEAAIDILRSGQNPFSITLSENTESDISNLVIDRLNAEHVGMDMNKGKMSVPVKEFDDDTRSVVRTPNAVVEMTKTGFVVKYPKK